MFLFPLLVLGGERGGIDSILGFNFGHLSFISVPKVGSNQKPKDISNYEWLLLIWINSTLVSLPKDRLCWSVFLLSYNAYVNCENIILSFKRNAEILLLFKHQILYQILFDSGRDLKTPPKKNLFMGTMEVLFMKL